MKKTPVQFSLAEIEAAMREMTGFCTDCGAPRDCCEPDARRYACEACGARAVYGAEELILMGRVDMDDGAKALS